MRDISDLSVARVKRLFEGAPPDRLAELIDAYADDPRPGVIGAVARARRRLTAIREEIERLDRLYEFEERLHASGCVAVAGLDEVGRGAIAGPLTVGACVLPPLPRIEGLDDSKRLNPRRREEVAARIRQDAITYAVVHVPAPTIDAIGITAALQSAMNQAVRALAVEVDHVVIDGTPLRVFTPETALVGGDSLVAAVAAASVLAKVERDALMCRLADLHPGYGFETHKGYGTASHMAAIRALGPSPEHRQSFCIGGGTGRLF